MLSVGNVTVKCISVDVHSASPAKLDSKGTRANEVE